MPEAKKYLVETTEDAVQAEVAWARAARKKPRQLASEAAEDEAEKK